MFDDHLLDLFSLLVLGRGVSVGGSGFLDTSLLCSFLLGGLGMALLVFLAFPLLGVFSSGSRLRVVLGLLLWRTLELGKSRGEGGIFRRLGGVVMDDGAFETGTIIKRLLRVTILRL